MKKINYKAVIFDLDGTLLNTLEDLADSMNSVLMKSGFPVHDVNSYRYFVGEGIEFLVSRALPNNIHTDKSIINQYVNAVREEYIKHWDKKTHPYKGIPELLDKLTELNIKLTVLSNKPDEFTKLSVAKFLSLWTFKIVLGARNTVPKKPDPAGAFEIAEHLKIATDEFLYLGDTGTDMKTAVSAGMYPVGVLWGFRESGELLNNGAKVLIKEPIELLRYL